MNFRVTLKHGFRFSEGKIAKIRIAEEVRAGLGASRPSPDLTAVGFSSPTAKMGIAKPIGVSGHRRRARLGNFDLGQQAVCG